MSLRIELHELVDGDVLDAWIWYEAQRRGLGDQFMNAVRASAARAARWPNIGQPALHDDSGNILERRLATVGFPYEVR